MRLVKFIVFLVILSISGQVYGQSSSELKRRKEALTREIETLNRSLNQTSITAISLS